MKLSKLLLLAGAIIGSVKSQCTCKNKAQCAGRLTPEELSGAVCDLEEDGQTGFGFCCTDVKGTLTPGAQFEIRSSSKAAAQSGIKRKIPSGVTSNDINKKIEDEKKNFPRTVSRRELDSEEIGHHIFNKERSSDEDIRESASILLHLGEDPLFSTRQSDEGLDAENSIEIRDVCSWTKERPSGRKPRCTPHDDLYRSVDGSCNNRFKPLYGMSGTPMQRILPSEYGQDRSGRSNLPRKARNGNILPSARHLSQNVFLRGDPKDTNGLSTLFMQMGQFIDHDLTHSPAPSAKCCEDNDDDKGWVYPGDPYNNNPDNCFAIEVHANDSFWGGKGRKCMEMSRSTASPPLDCRAGVREQMTALTHWLDASNIYGSTEEEAEQVRDDDSALLRTTRRGRLGRDLLPTCSNPGLGRSAETIEACDNELCLDARSGCFFSGDLRVNEQPGLTVMHTVWTREHNRVAEELRAITTWDDEKVYQESRKIVVAEWQHIIYNEWLPLLLGSEYMDNFNLFPRTSGYSDDYDSNMDPRINNEFAAAAFRFGHSMIPTIHPGKDSRGRDITPAVDFKEAFDNPSLLMGKHFVEDTIRGQSQDAAPAWDPVFVDDVVNHLFESNEDNDGGLDLTAINIQRARDHGVPGYNSYRGICASASGGYRQAEDFDDLLQAGFLSRDDVLRLKKVYAHVDDIDLFVGGTLEEGHKDSILGPAFKCIIGDQFIRAKRGDRFWYENGEHRQSRFLESQLREIRKASMARILCDNTDIARVQPLVFQTEGGPVNQFIRCDDGLTIPRLDLDTFNPTKPGLLKVNENPGGGSWNPHL